MEIRPSSHFESTNLRARESSVKKDVSATPKSDEVSIENTERSKNLLSENEEVRPDVVARGKELAASSDYPPAETVEKLASFLADKLSKTEDI